MLQAMIKAVPMSVSNIQDPFNISKANNTYKSEETYCT